MRIPSLKYLRTFQIAGRHLSFKEAADELAITPSAVSQQVKNLEAYIGVPLFERRTRSLEFTDAGRLYFEYLNTMFSRLESETEQLRAQYGRKIVRVSAPPFFASEVLLKRIASFQASSAELDIRVSTQPSRLKTHPALADISILLGKGDWPGLVTYRLFQRCYVVAGAPALLKDASGVQLTGRSERTNSAGAREPRGRLGYLGAAGRRPGPAAEEADAFRFDVGGRPRGRAGPGYCAWSRGQWARTGSARGPWCAYSKRKCRPVSTSSWPTCRTRTSGQRSKACWTGCSGSCGISGEKILAVT